MPPSPSARSGKPRSGASRPTRGTVLPLVPGSGRPPVPRLPLPDATAVRLLPSLTPPRRTTTRSPTAGGRRPGPGRSRWPLPRPAPRRPRTGRPRPRLTRGGTHQGVRRPPGTPGPPPQQRRPAAEPGWPSQFAQVLAETLAGARNQGQIVPWTTDQARRRIRQLGPMLAAGTAPRVPRIMTSRPTDSAVEMTVVVGFGSRVRALAVRAGARRAAPGQPGPGRTGGAVGLHGDRSGLTP